MSVVQPAMVVALANARLRDIDEALTRKLDATTVQVRVGSGRPGVGRNRFGATERRVLGLVRAASQMVAGPDPVTVPTSSGLYPGPSKYAVLGSAGFEIPAYADMFSPSGAWRAATMRRGTPDPFMSLVSVPTTTFVNAVGARTVADAAGADAATRQGAAFTMGLVGALAHATVAGPVQRSAHGRRTSRAWTRTRPGPENLATDLAALARLVGGGDPVGTFQGWWPTLDEAGAVLTSYHAALDATYQFENRAPGAHGWPAFETALAAGPALSTTRVKDGYERLRGDLVPWTTAQWWGVLSPVLLSPGLALLAGRFLPGASAFMTTDTVTERSLSELITVSDGIGSITPFIYSMIMWANIGEPTEPFVNALWTFIVRMGLVAGWIPTIGSATDDPSPGGRWGIAGGMLALDVYALVRLLIALGGTAPGPKAAFGVQNIPAVITLATLAQAGVVKSVVAVTKAAGADDDGASIAGWVTWALTTLGWLGVGVPIARALARGSGWMSWFATEELPTLRGAMAASSATEILDGAAAFDDSTLWSDPSVAAPTLADLRYPTGGRPLVKVWRASGSAPLEIAHRGHAVRIRNGATVTDVVIGPGSRTVDDIVTALTAVAGVQAAAVDAGPRYDVPWPASVQDPTGDSDPRPADDDAAHDAFVPIPDDAAKPYLLRHVADEDLATRYGRAGASKSAFDGLRGVPREALADLDDTMLGTAAELAVVLGLGAASRLRAVQPVAPDPNLVPGAPAVAGPIGPVSQVFRDWNLDHRRVNEWRTIVAGGASREAAPPADAELADGARVAEAMGWLPLWRAWLRVATDTQQDAGAIIVSPDTPVVRAADGSSFRPTNQQLSRGVRYLLDLPA